ncbi:DUF4097 family beta strand repeat-containing protein [Mucilaginibacter gotjawali]|uniref:DUF4097 and DUF4098 domain-containing protein YvlB n=1 Tax=Mucilaginibacter gotjawali TaxID=1550579 RepID=A0A839SLY4_9SPHI|nr:DUF4097 family beta strand repeat-containing protein [Mucilaginibacter gotjawali]MBB3058886.1 DUF4097 and DUF4098 domain-containing protein YvlB [Mucilaginibacter gotjawali]
MKTFLTLFIVACQSMVALAQDGDNKTPYLTKSLAGDAINSVIVSTSAGGISVSGATGQEPRVEVYIRGNNGHQLSKEEIAKRLEKDYDMDILVNGHELSAMVKNKHNFTNWRESLSISFKIFVPEHVSTDLKTSGGGISLDHLQGNENFVTSGGGLELRSLSGSVHGHTSGGGIDVSNSGEDIDLSTSGGGIIAKNCSGKIRLVTSGGGLILEGLKGDINAHTSGGGIEGSNIEGELVTGTSGGGIDLKHMRCSLEAGTSAGDLTAQMDAVGKYVKLNASSGGIRLSLPVKQGLDLEIRGEGINQHPQNISGFTGNWDKHHINGSVNGGGIPVNAHAEGYIDVKFN